MTPYDEWIFISEGKSSYQISDSWDTYWRLAAGQISQMTPLEYLNWIMWQWYGLLWDTDPQRCFHFNTIGRRHIGLLIKPVFCFCNLVFIMLTSFFVKYFGRCAFSIALPALFIIYYILVYIVFPYFFLLLQYFVFYFHTLWSCYIKSNTIYGSMLSS